MKDAKTRRKATPAGTDGKVHLHIENLSRLGDVFTVTPKRIKEALARHPEVAKRVRITTGLDNKTLDRQLRTADVLFGWEIPDRESLAERAPRLRWMHAHGAGVSHLMPLDWLPKGAVLTNSAGVHGERAAEYAIMALLMLNNRVPEMMANQRYSRWQPLFNSSIAGKTVLIVGVGAVGGDAARHAKRYGLHVLGVRRSGKTHRSVDEMYKPNALSRLLPRADFVLVTAPDTRDTHHMIGARELDLMKKGAGIVVYSRAGLVDYKTLEKKLRKGELSAVLDVFDPEPLPKRSSLWKTPNLIITPHSSSDDVEYYTPRTLDLVFENMARFIAGRKLKNVVDPKLQY